MHVSVYHVCVWYLWWPEGMRCGVRTGVLTGGELPGGYWELSAGPLEAVLTAAEPALQLLLFVVCCLSLQPWLVLWVLVLKICTTTPIMIFCFLLIRIYKQVDTALYWWVSQLELWKTFLSQLTCRFSLVAWKSSSQATTQGDSETS